MQFYQVGHTNYILINCGEQTIWRNLHTVTYAYEQ